MLPLGVLGGLAVYRSGFRLPLHIRVEGVDRAAEALVGEALEVRAADAGGFDLNHFGCDGLEGGTEVGGALQNEDTPLGRLDAEGAEEVQIVRVAAPVYLKNARSGPGIGVDERTLQGFRVVETLRQQFPDRTRARVTL